MLEQAETAVRCKEAEDVFWKRFNEAHDAGLIYVEARRFAKSTTDVGLLRKLVEGGCNPQMISRILL